jgi:hypothetical protein
MYSALKDAVEIEFLIEGKRPELFAKVTNGEYSNADHLPLVSSCEFLVQKITSTEGGFVFEVVHNDKTLNYFAFKHNGYFFCPAFLCEIFELEVYSCLVVKNLIDYYYIILKPGPPDPFPLISDYFIKLPQRFNFGSPTDEDKLLILEFNNKDSFMIVTRENRDKHSLDLLGEFYYQSPIWVPLYNSNRDSNYIFLSRDVTIDLKAKYGDLFNCYVIKDNIVLHQSSAAAKKAKEIINLINENERLSSTFLPNAFKNTDYIREGYDLDELINIIKYNQNSSRINKDTNYSFMFGIFQSSGYGKSRLIERLGMKIPTFYSSLQHPAGHPKGSFILRMLFEKLHTIIECVSRSNTCYLNNISTATYVYIL